MKKGLQYLLAIATVLFFACGKDNGNSGDSAEDKSSSSNYDLKREEIIGKWDIEKAKFDKAATMTDWDLGPTTFEFKENGFFEAKGYFGNGTGSFSIQGATITTVLENKPFIDFEIFGIQDKKVDVVATIRSSKQQVWMTWYQPLVVIGGGEVSDEQFFNDEKNVRMAVLAVYDKLIDFVVNKQSIEYDVVGGKFDKLSPSGHEIMNCWQSAYESLYRINGFLDVLGQDQYKDRYDGYIAHLRALRAFIAYNLATLWGQARFETIAHVPMTQPGVLSATELLQVADNDLIHASMKNYSLKGVETKKYLNPDACQLLMAEVEMTLGNPEGGAKDIFNAYVSNSQSPDVCFEFIQSDANGTIVQTIPVYTKSYVERLSLEASGKIGELTQSLKGNSTTYGFWQMLKRIGIAESFTGCQKYQLLFPYPWNEISEDFPQNQGY